MYVIESRHDTYFLHTIKIIRFVNVLTLHKTTTYNIYNIHMYVNIYNFI